VTDPKKEDLKCRLRSSMSQWWTWQELRAGLVDEILIHLAPYLIGGSVKLFDELAGGVRLEQISVSDGPLATHLRYRVVRDGVV
jgi:riboflavin biosynthesis pyrimidine reductase